ncbi:MAG TPA: hypothetical protein VJ716_06400 [Gaiellaceae bacterium]|nr:hypothetical protein [Gaiellaceae bacterium]
MTSLSQELPRPVVASNVLSQVVEAGVPLVGFVVFTLVWIGRGVVLHPTTRVLGDALSDKTILMWSFLWWPHAIAHGQDPFHATAVWAPHGVDLAWVTSSPTLGLLLTPLSETVGPVFAYNFAALAAPPLAAWTAYLLARRLTGNLAASLFAGFLFGFSPYVVGQSIGHLNLSFVCLVPLAGLLAVRVFQGSLGRRRYTVALAVVLALQFGISTEIFATLTLLGVVCFVLAFFLLDSRARLAALARSTALAYVAAGAIVSPYLVHAFASGTTPPLRPHRNQHSLDLANIVFPTRATWLRPPHSHAVVSRFASNIDEIGGYVGVPLLVVVVLAAVLLQGRLRRGVWLLLLAAIAACAMAAGPTVRVAGHPLVTGIWAGIDRLPALGEALPIRLEMYSGLFLVLAAAIWLAQPGRRIWRWGLACLAVASLLPTPGSAFWTSHVRQSRFFESAANRVLVHRGDTALVLPYMSRHSWSMLWQAETHFRFTMIGGHVGQAIIPSECPWYRDYESLGGGRPPGGAAGFRRFLLAHHVNVVLEGPRTSTRVRTLIAASLPDVPQVHLAGVTVLRLSNLSRALPHDAPPLSPTRRRNHGPWQVCSRLHKTRRPFA